jgi:hypothetical protein
MSKRFENEGIDLIAVSLTPPPYVDEGELLVIARNQSRVFLPNNLQVRLTH